MTAPTTYPIERKVTAATAAGGGAGGAVAAVLVWALDRYAFAGTGTPEVVSAAVYALVLTGLPAVAAYGAGYRAHHTPRTPVPVPPAVPAEPARGEAEAAGERLHRPGP